MSVSGRVIMPCPSNWAISFSRCLKAISSSELAVFIVCCLGVESSFNWFICWCWKSQHWEIIGQVPGKFTEEITGKLYSKETSSIETTKIIKPINTNDEPICHRKNLAVALKSLKGPMWHQIGLGQRWAGNWNTSGPLIDAYVQLSCSFCSRFPLFSRKHGTVGCHSICTFREQCGSAQNVFDILLYWLVCNSEVPHWPYIFHTTGSCCIAYLLLSTT